jgi:heme/copper-type cytochrome/quinol oxidase subunit 2
MILPAAFALGAKSAPACAVCYGASDAPMARGMNWGIFSLLGVIGTVLCGVAGVGVFFAKRAAMVAAEDAANISGDSKKV